MDNTILEFLDIYKKLDELCRQILSSDRGVSEYIDQMDSEKQGYRIDGWQRDYKQLKRMRWLRNRLVHDTDSFEDNPVNIEDTEWLHTFYNRIMECTDPFSLLYQSEKMNRKTGKQEKDKDITLDRKVDRKEKDTNIILPIDDTSYSRNEDLSDKEIILAGIILAGVILLGIVLYFLIFLRV